MAGDGLTLVLDDAQHKTDDTQEKRMRPTGGRLPVAACSGGLYNLLSDSLVCCPLLGGLSYY